MLQADGHSFSDVAAKVVSIINLASVAAVEDAVGAPVDPLRFRGNLYVEGWPAWHEFDLLGQTLSIGDVRLKVVKRIVRCAATNVEPRTGIRDLEIPHTLMQTFGHMDCGVYAEVIDGGDDCHGRCRSAWPDRHRRADCRSPRQIVSCIARTRYQLQARLRLRRHIIARIDRVELIDLVDANPVRHLDRVRIGAVIGALSDHRRRLLMTTYSPLPIVSVVPSSMRIVSDPSTTPIKVCNAAKSSDRPPCRGCRASRPAS